MKQDDKTLRKLDGVLAFASKAAGIVAGAMLVALIVLLVVDVVARNFFESPIGGLAAYAQTTLVALVFLAMPYGQRMGLHVSMGFVADRLRPRVSAAVQATSLAILVPLLAYLTYRTAVLAVDSVERGESSLGLVAVPIWPARAMLTLGLAILTLEVLRSALVQARLFRRGSSEGLPESRTNDQLVEGESL